MVKRILLLVDDTTQSEIAAEYALSLAQKYTSQLLLFPLANKTPGIAVANSQLSPVLRQAESAGIPYQILSTHALTFSKSIEWAKSSDLAVCPYHAPAGARRTGRRLIKLLSASGCAVCLPSTGSCTGKSAAIIWDGSGACAKVLKLHLQLFPRSYRHYLLIYAGDDPEKAESILGQGCALVEAHGAYAETLASSGYLSARIAMVLTNIQADHLIIAPDGKRVYCKEQLGESIRKILQQRTSSLFVAI